MTRSTSLRAGSAAAGVAAVLFAACLAREGNPHPLYPNSEQPRARGELARLAGPIGVVDGQDVARFGKSFTLLPGCHIVQPVSKVAEVDRTSPNAYVAAVPANIIYALRMQARHTYELDVRPADNAAQTSTDAAVQMWDRDDAGHATAIPPAASEAELAACGAAKP